MQNELKQIKAVVFHLESTLVEPSGPGAQPPENPTAIAGSVFRYLRSKTIRLAILSDDYPVSAQKKLAARSFSNAAEFDVIISRKQLQNPDDDIDAVTRAAQKMGLPVNNIAVVAADASILRAAREAGALTVHLGWPEPSGKTGIEADFHISQIADLRNIVRQYIPLPPGKLPNDLLRAYLNQFVFNDPSILVNPGVGEDTAAVDVAGEEVLVLKSDPITFATDSIGQYAVLINANDIATSGAKPRWLLTTLLFPCGVTPAEIRRVIDELKDFCRQWDITLCGGHTEITDAVNRPVVTGMMAGTVARRDLIDKRNMAPGDRILLTKGVAVEGTAIISREFGGRLTDLGMSERDIDSGRRFLANISIITEARIAAASKMVSAMHDVTEGGLATAVEELSVAGGYRIEIDTDSIPVFDETRTVCDLLNIDPLGLIGSGSLLICCREEAGEGLLQEIRKAGIDVNCIGKVLEKGQGITALKNSRPVAWPQFEVDEIARLF